jgi:hypothetical protein
MNNNAYNQLFAGFTEGEKEELIISDHEIDSIYTFGGITSVLNEKGEVKITSSGGNPDYAVIKQIMDDIGMSNWDGKTIIVIANRNQVMVEKERTLGYNKGNYTVIYNSASNDFPTYTHELGHAFGLLHPFSDNDDNKKTIPLIQKGTSQNYMDYSPIINMFWKWQWDILRREIGKPDENKERKK